MVTCKVDTVAVPKMNSVRTRKPSSSNSSGFRLLDGDQLEATSSVSRNSVYKLKIDLMFDDTRSVRSNRLDDPRGSHRTRSIIMYGRSELASTAGASSRSITSILQDTSSDPAKIIAESTKKDVRRLSNSVQAQIEQLFTDVAKDATSSFAVTCLGSLPLKDKVTSLQGLQEPLRELYLNELANEKRESGYLDICTTGLRVKINTNATGSGRENSTNNNNSSNSVKSNSNSSNNNNNNNGNRNHSSNNNHNNNNNNNNNIICNGNNNKNSNSNSICNNNSNSTNNNNNNTNNNTNNNNNYNSSNNSSSNNNNHNSITTANINIKNNSITTTTNNNNNNNNKSNNDSNITPFHNIAVWSAVKFVLSEEDGGAAFLPLITDPENIDKSTLFQPLSPAEHKSAANSTHAPIFAVVMRAPGIPKLLECHGFICKSTEDAIVIAATLYQSLMAHVNANSQRNTKRRTPRNQNGVSCISIASSSAQTGSNYLSRSQVVSSGRKSSFRSSTGSRPSFSGSIGVVGSSGSPGSIPATTRSVRKKRVSNSSLSSSSNVINEAVETTTEERKRRSHKTKRAPPVPMPTTAVSGTVATPTSLNGSKHASKDMHAGNVSVRSTGRNSTQRSYQQSSHHHSKSRSSVDTVYRASEMLGGGAAAAVVAAAAASASGGVGVGIRNESNGDILTRVAIPRSGSFLNTGGLTRYKSRAARRHTDKLGGGHGGGGGSPLGFSELFNEFRLHENLHSLDDILYAIIDADGMSFNDLKPIYKEFLLKLAVTLTKDELYQRSKNIMRRQKKKKLKRRTSNAGSQKKPRTHIFGTKGLKKVFQLGQFRSCRGKPPKPPRHKDQPIETKSRKSGCAQLVIGPPTSTTKQHQTQQQQQQQQRSRVATSGSDVSVIRHENGFNGLNRNSSSGYVSCSECSYDSEACTCASADRCYCSLRNEQLNNKQRRKNELNAAMVRKASKQSQHQNQNQPQTSLSTPGSNRSARTSNNNTTNNNSSSSRNNRHSLISCKSDEKCYCSMVEEEPADAAVDDEVETLHTQSDTTWCDTDSCVSASKCYCKREERRSRNSDATYTREEQQQLQETASRRHQSRSSYRKSGNDKLALDYELFTISGNGKSVQPHEALSMKKSVEAAAIFADVKLRQTTDIKSLCASAAIQPFMQGPSSRRSGSSSVSRGSSKLQYHSGSSKRRESQSIDRRNERNILTTLSSNSCNSSQKSYSAEDLLSKLTAIEEVVGCGASIRSSVGKQREIHQFTLREKHFQNNYQSMKAVSASLEDTLGYLP